MSQPDKSAFATRVIHAGQSPDPTTGALMPPIYANSTYLQDSPGVHKGFDYGRSHNPTRFALERCVADLEGGSQAFAFASGLAAISTVLELLDAGAHIVSGNDLYGGTFRLFDKVRQRSAGHRFSYVDLSDLSAFEASLQDDTRMVWVETPSNPLLSSPTCAPSHASAVPAELSAWPTTPSPARGSSGHWNWVSISWCTPLPSI